MIGSTISHYKIIEKLGEGGMGVVYKALDLKLDRFVALKFFPHELYADKNRKTKFVQEAKIASSIDHPNVVAIYEIDEPENADLFIAMAYYEGMTLDKKIRDGFLRLDEAVDIALQTAHGLSKSHRLGIVHQDIKPANILVTQDGTAKILDFGVAKLSAVLVPGELDLSVGGTLLYMSPEQVRGEPVDRRTDIWSLGVVLYEMVARRLPFSSDYDQAIQYSILNEKHSPIEGIPSNVSQELHRILDKAMEKNPENRFQHVDEMIGRLKTLRKKIRPDSEIQKPAIAVLPFDDLSPQGDQEFFCDGLTEELINALTKIEGLRVASRISAFQFKGKAEDIRTIGKHLNVKTVLGGSVRKSGDRLRITAQLVDVATGYQLSSEQYNRTLSDIFSIQEEIAQMIVQTLKVQLLPDQSERLVTRHTANLDAYNLYLEGRYYWNKRTEDNLKKAVQLFQEAIERCGENLRMTVSGLRPA